MSKATKKVQQVWFVDPEVSRVDVAEGFWIECKKKLTVKESRRAMASAVDVDMAGKITPRLDKLGLTEVAAYVVDWNLTDTNGKAVPYSAEALENLSLEGFTLIEEAVKAHVEASAVAKKANANTSNQDSESAG